MSDCELCILLHCEHLQNVHCNDMHINECKDSFQFTHIQHICCCSRLTARFFLKIITIIHNDARCWQSYLFFVLMKMMLGVVDVQNCYVSASNNDTARWCLCMGRQWYEWNRYMLGKMHWYKRNTRPKWYWLTWQSALQGMTHYSKWQLDGYPITMSTNTMITALWGHNRSSWSNSPLRTLAHCLQAKRAPNENQHQADHNLKHVSSAQFSFLRQILLRFKKAREIDEILLSWNPAEHHAERTFMWIYYFFTTFQRLEARQPNQHSMNRWLMNAKLWATAGQNQILTNWHFTSCFRSNSVLHSSKLLLHFFVRLSIRVHFLCEHRRICCRLTRKIIWFCSTRRQFKTRIQQQPIFMEHSQEEIRRKQNCIK